MIILFPVGVEDAEVNRLPWVSIVIAALCFVAFLISWVLPVNPQGVDESALFEVITYWREHPYLVLPEPFKDRFIPKNVQQHLKSETSEETSDQRPEPEVLQKEQATLDEMAARVVAMSDRSILRRFSMIPARGMSQVGWLTHMFLHFGWIHILGNLFFFYLVGPLMEDVWGRPLFGGFYLAGGLAAALAQFALDRGSTVMMAGASGAIAACMGAFALRYATRRVRLAYFIWYFRIWRGTTMWPAWVCGLLWFLNEAWSFWRTGGNSGVAVMAHMGGFAFGAALAFGLRASGIESKYVAPKVEAKFTWQRHPAIQKAEAALEQKNFSAAQEAYREVLAADPKNLEAQFGLAKIAILEHRTAEGVQKLEPLLSHLAARSEHDKAMGWIEDIVPALDPKELRPAFAYKIAQVIDAGPEGLRPLGERFYARAGAAGAILGAKAFIRAAAIALSAPDGAEGALRHLAAAEAIPELPAESKTQLAELRAEAQKKLAPVGAFRSIEAAPEGSAMSRAPVRPLTEGVPEAAMTASSERVSTGNTANPQMSSARPSTESVTSPHNSAAPKPIVLNSRLKQIREDGLDLDVQSKGALVAWNRLLAIGVGIIPAGAQKNLVVTDLVVSSKKNGARPTVLRIPGGALGLDTLYPGIRPRDAFQQLIGELLARSGARPLPNPDSLSSGNYPRFADISQLESTFYGATA
ncbi:MAG TPA: rhomboid family intramembrane serine protease [Myxococcaceae bacterium]|nr:rhomboid family intramembrane serine protease [Myxococcaceae bacterium]